LQSISNIREDGPAKGGRHVRDHGIRQPVDGVPVDGVHIVIVARPNHVARRRVDDADGHVGSSVRGIREPTMQNVTAFYFAAISETRRPQGDILEVAETLLDRTEQTRGKPHRLRRRADDLGRLDNDAGRPIRQHG
jgi:hypothetical protein